jgi:hypothetical protein
VAARSQARGHSAGSRHRGRFGDLGQLVADFLVPFGAFEKAPAGAAVDHDVGLDHRHVFGGFLARALHAAELLGRAVAAARDARAMDGNAFGREAPELGFHRRIDRGH